MARIGFNLVLDYTATNSVVRACVAVTPDNPQVVYALFGNNNNGFYGVYKSVNEDLIDFAIRFSKFVGLVFYRK